MHSLTFFSFHNDDFHGAGPEFRERGFFGKMFYILLFAALQRQKYYFAWKLGIQSAQYFTVVMMVH